MRLPFKRCDTVQLFVEQRRVLGLPCKVEELWQKEKFKAKCWGVTEDDSEIICVFRIYEDGKSYPCFLALDEVLEAIKAGEIYLLKPHSQRISDSSCWMEILDEGDG